VEKIGVTLEKHQPAESKQQTLSHKVV